MTITQYVKDISYDRETHDYAMRLDGELIGYARTHHEAEVELDQIVYELLMAQPAPDEKICPTCAGEGDCPDCCPTVVGPDLATDLYNVVCLTLSGAAATTAIAELRRVQARYESEVGK